MLRRFLSRFHRWQYRNPYDRTCLICGRHEVNYTWTIYPTNPMTQRGWWEAHSEGDPTAHQPRKNRSKP